MALAGTALLWEQDGNPPGISWIHRAPIQQMSSPANSRWYDTSRVQVSTGMLTEGTNLQDTSLWLSFPFLERSEGQTPAHSLAGAHTHTNSASTLAGTHTQSSLCAATPSACVSTQRATQMCVQTLHTHTPVLTRACSHVHTAHRVPLLLSDTGRGHTLPPQHAAGSLGCQHDPGSCLALLFLSGGAVLGHPCSEGLISTVNVFMDNLSPVVPVLMLSFS